MSTLIVAGAVALSLIVAALLYGLIFWVVYKMGNEGGPADGSIAIVFSVVIWFGVLVWIGTYLYASLSVCP